jgi:TrmH family RNA methyltransferase
MKRVTSPDNPGFKALRLLAHSGRERRKQGRTVLDGPHLVASYLAAGFSPLQLVVSDSGLEDTEIRRIVHAQPDIPLTVLSDHLCQAASPVETPTGLLAVIEVPVPPPLERIASSCVVLDAVQDAGNVGSILRSAAAAGIGLALLTAGCAQAWSPKALRAAMGGHFGLGIVEHADVSRLLADYPGRIVATGVEGAESLFDVDLSGMVAWLFGGEGAGLSPALHALAAGGVRIPMPGAAESLNVAAAAAVCLFEQVRQKGLHRECAGAINGIGEAEKS